MKTLQIIFVLLLCVYAKAAKPQNNKNQIATMMDTYELDISSGVAITEAYCKKPKQYRNSKPSTPTIQNNKNLKISIVPLESKSDAFLLTVEPIDPIKTDITLLIRGADKWKTRTYGTAFAVHSELSISDL